MRPLLRVCVILFLLQLIPAASAAEPVRGQPGVLVFADGDRLTGRLVAEGVFVSPRFGEVRFERTQARFEASERTLADDTPGGLRARVEEDLTGRPRDASPLAKAVPPPADAPTPTDDTSSGVKSSRPWWHPWKITISGYLDRTREDGVPRHEFFTGLRIQHPRTDGLLLSADARYEFVRKSGRIDKRRATFRGDIRKDLGGRWFALYFPFAEYDGRNLAEPLDGRTRQNYLMSQHQAGIGYHLLDKPKLRSQIAATWSYFHLKEFHVGSSDADAPAFYIENELYLPFGFEVKQTGHVYYIGERVELDLALGWENLIDFTKRLGPHVFVTLRHEYRKDYPVPRTNAIQRARLLLGVNF